jgi:hypothetical protein
MFSPYAPSTLVLPLIPQESYSFAAAQPVASKYGSCARNNTHTIIMKRNAGDF